MKIHIDPTTSSHVELLIETYKLVTSQVIACRLLGCCSGVVPVLSGLNTGTTPEQYPLNDGTIYKLVSSCMLPGTCAVSPGTGW